MIKKKKNPDISNVASKSSVTALDNKINEIKLDDYAKKTTLSNYLLNSDFDTKKTELET